MRTESNAIASASAHAAALRLRVDAVTAEVVDALSNDGISSLVLKGPSIAGWLYPDGTRTYVDSDVLVPAAGVGFAEARLRAIGFRPGQRGWQNVSRSWNRGNDLVDLHTSLFAVGAAPERVWEELSRRTTALHVANREVVVMTHPALAFHIAVHSAQHGDLGPASLDDLRRVLAAADPECWREAAALASTLSALPAFATGLCLLPEGRVVARGLGVAGERSALATLHAGGAEPLVLGLEHLSAAPDHRARLRFLGRKLVPSRAYMRSHSRLARKGPGGLLLAYAWRPLWLLLRLPRAAAAWRTVRRESASDRPAR